MSKSEYTAGPLAEITLKRQTLLQERDALRKNTEKRLADINQHLDELRSRENALMAGIDVYRIDRAKAVIYVRGKLSKANKTTFPSDSRAYHVEAAKHDLASGCKHLKKQFYGVKNYDGFGDQSSNSEYGYGPRHGSIVFAIGLTQEARQRDLTDQEVEDAIYYLSVLKDYEVAATSKPEAA